MAAGDLSLKSETEEAARFCSRGSRCRIALCLKPPSPVLLRALPPRPTVTVWASSHSAGPLALPCDIRSDSRQRPGPQNLLWVSPEGPS